MLSSNRMLSVFNRLHSTDRSFSIVSDFYIPMPIYTHYAHVYNMHAMVNRRDMLLRQVLTVNVSTNCWVYTHNNIILRVCNYYLS